MVDHMIVGQNVAVGRDEKARALRTHPLQRHALSARFTEPAEEELERGVAALAALIEARCSIADFGIHVDRDHRRFEPLDQIGKARHRRCRRSNRLRCHRAGACHQASRTLCRPQTERRSRNGNHAEPR